LFAQKHELGLMLGVNTGAEVTLRPGSLNVGSGITYVAIYGVRLAGGDAAAFYFEVHFAATPLQDVTSDNPVVPRDYASLFLTPGLRMKFAPGFFVSPWVAAGGGYAQFEQSSELPDGTPNPGLRRIHRGAIDFGGGVDVRLWRWLALRGEVRDFYSGNPAYNASVSGGGQHNVVASGGFVLRFGE
jgi:hypothetical protein